MSCPAKIVATRGLRISSLAVVMMACASVAACGHPGPPQRVDLGTLIADGKSFNEQRVVLKGCLEANPHGLILLSCPRGREELVVFQSDALKERQGSLLYSEALKSKIQHQRPLGVTLCGTYRQTPEGRDNWMDLEAFAIEGGQTASSANCSL